MRKIAATVMTAITAVSLLMTNVSSMGEEYFYQDFENVSANDTKSGFTSGSVNEPDLLREIIDDPYMEDNKVVKFVNRRSGVNVINSYLSGTKVVEGECIFTFDYMQLSTIGNPLDVKYVMVELNKGGPSGDRPRIGLTMINYADGFRLTPEDDVWYSFLVYVNEDFSTLTLYRKERDSDEPYAFVRNQNRGNITGTATACVRTYCGQVDYMMDNIRLYQGSFGGEGCFTMDGEKITSIEDVTNGTLVAKVDYTSDQIRTEASGGSTVITDSGEVYPFVVVYDGAGKMIDCVYSANGGIRAGSQELSAELDTSGFYDKLDGGYIGFYVWKDFETAEPLVDAVELY